MKARSPEARALLAEYRRGQGLQPAARERVARALERRLAGGAPGLPFDAPPPQLPLNTIAPRALWGGGKLAGVVLGIGLASIAALWSAREAPTRPSRTAPSSLRTGASTASADEPRPRAAVAPSPVSERVPPASDTDVAAPRRKRAREPERRPSDQASPAAPPPAVFVELEMAEPAKSAGARAPLTVPPPEPEPALDDAPRQGAQGEAVMIDEEVALLRSAHAALRAANPKRALAHLAEHRWRFPHGQLADSREVARMLALCASGEAALARVEAERFLTAQPRSPFAQRVRGICVERER
jgi:hypothetical protein